MSWGIRPKGWDASRQEAVSDRRRRPARHEKITANN